MNNFWTQILKRRIFLKKFFSLSRPLTDPKYFLESEYYLKSFDKFIRSTRVTRPKMNSTDLRTLTDDDEDDGINDENIIDGEEPIIILNWYDNRYDNKSKEFLSFDYGRNWKGYKYLYQSSPSCGSCWFTNDRNFEKRADSILIDNTQFPSVNSDVPNTVNRTQNQYWVFWGRESATKGFDTIGKFVEPDRFGNILDSSYNLTTSYRSDSDIPYHPKIDDILVQTRYQDGEIEVDNDDEYLEKILKNKFTLEENRNYAAWLVSNCDNTPGAVARLEMSKRMKKAGINFDGYGKCFEDNFQNFKNRHYKKGELDRGHRWRGHSEDNISQYLSKYKFYFAFENAMHCNDYLSEKFWRNSLETELVPIVYGVHKMDLERLAPPNSYIYVDDDTDLEKLAKDLFRLHKNDEAYMKYHEWRRLKPDFSKVYSDIVHSATGKSSYGHVTEVNRKCGLCQMMREKKKLEYPKKMIKSVSTYWWLDLHDESCLGIKKP